MLLKSQMVQYVPVKGDKVDEALGEFINGQPKGSMKVMFVRMDPGIYQFGSKKICIKVEQGKIIIRVGGGYMYIDEFLDQYTTVELEKSIRDGLDPMGGERSPMRVPGKGANPQVGRSPSPKKLLHRLDASPVPENCTQKYPEANKASGTK